MHTDGHRASEVSGVIRYIFICVLFFGVGATHSQHEIVPSGKHFPVIEGSTLFLPLSVLVPQITEETSIHLTIYKERNTVLQTLGDDSVQNGRYKVDVFKTVGSQIVSVAFTIDNCGVQDTAAYRFEVIVLDSGRIVTNMASDNTIHVVPKTTTPTPTTSTITTQQTSSPSILPTMPDHEEESSTPADEGGHDNGAIPSMDNLVLVLPLLVCTLHLVT